MNLYQNTVKDVLDKLSSVPSKQGYMKDLIRAVFAQEKAER